MRCGRRRSSACAARWALLVRTLIAFARVEPVAALLLLPYLAWTGYAGYLAAGFWWLNS